MKSVPVEVTVSGENEPPRPPLRVLIADDNPVVRLSLHKLLRLCGCEVDDATNGRQVLDRVRRRGYDVILIDIQMPEMDGLETAQRLAALFPLERRPRLIAMSADPDPETLTLARVSGMSQLLVKPVRFDELARVLGCPRPRVLEPVISAIS